MIGALADAFAAHRNPGPLRAALIDADTAAIETQLEVLRSRTLAANVIDKLDAYAKPVENLMARYRAIRDELRGKKKDADCDKLLAEARNQGVRAQFLPDQAITFEIGPSKG